MTDIVERLHAQVASDHVRGCMGRQYSCSCGYDAETERLLAEAADEIERLRAALQTVREENDRAKRQFTNISNKILDDACRALEPKP